jgi:hypothetical protein
VLEAGQSVTDAGRAVMVAVRVLKTVDVVTDGKDEVLEQDPCPAVMVGRVAVVEAPSSVGGLRVGSDVVAESEPSTEVEVEPIEVEMTVVVVVVVESVVAMGAAGIGREDDTHSRDLG